LRRIQQLIQELRAARDGGKTEATVTGTLAMAAAIPAAIAGVFLGWWLTPDNAGAGQLTLAVGGAAFGLSFLVVAVILAAHCWFGPRAVARIANSLIGVFVGFGIGLGVNELVTLGPWPFVIPPVAAIIGLLAPTPMANVNDPSRTQADLDESS
jgi:hypothetical protein